MSLTTANEVMEIKHSLLQWYEREKRDLPWRSQPSPYRVWVSEVMLQQTQVKTVIPYFERFIERFPSVRDLANTSLDEVLKVWENLGYYSRARNLHRAAMIVADSYDGRLPDNKDDLMALPGIGLYMAGAILSIAFNQRVPAVDGNLRRVISRLYAIDDPVNKNATQKRIEELTSNLVPQDRPGEFNQAMMDLGAKICIPRNPLCLVCPLNALCLARITGREQSLPVVEKKKPVPVREALAAVIHDDLERFLLLQRPGQGFLGGLWHWPQCEVMVDMKSEDGIIKVMEKSIALKLQFKRRIGVVKHQYTHFKIILHVFEFRLKDANSPKIPTGRWVSGGELIGLALSKADRKIWELLGH